VAFDEAIRPIRALRASFGVGGVEGHHPNPRRGQTVAKTDHHPVILVGARAMGEKQPGGAVTGEATGHLAARPWDSNG
jgi:hypothetical protein